MRVGILGCGGIGLACAAWLAHHGHAVTLWSPGGAGAQALRSQPLRSEGVLQAQVALQVAGSARELAQASDLLLLAVPVNGHRAVCDALLPHLADGQTVVVSSMNSLSSLYLFEAARRLGRQITVVALGSTVLTARRLAPDLVRIMMRRARLGMSVLPAGQAAAAQALCVALFGEVFTLQPNMLVTTLANVNPVSHGPLAVFNWTRIERAEAWPQYQCMTPHVAAVIKRLDEERQALARAFGLAVDPLERHFALSFGTQASSLPDIAAELHASRGGPPGPTDVQTRFVREDMPYGLVFHAALGRVAGLAMPATQAIVAAASLVAAEDFTQGNDLLAPLDLATATRESLLERVGVQ